MIIDFATLAPIVLALAAFITALASFLGQRNARYKAEVDKADAADKMTESGVRLVASALDLRKISEDKADVLTRENEELKKRLTALELQAASQQNHILLLEQRVTELETALTASNVTIADRDRTISLLSKSITP